MVSDMPFRLRGQLKIEFYRFLLFFSFTAWAAGRHDAEDFIMECFAKLEWLVWCNNRPEDGLLIQEANWKLNY